MLTLARNPGNEGPTVRKNLRVSEVVLQKGGGEGLKSGRTSTDPSDGRSPVDSFVVPVHAVGRSVVLVCADQVQVSCLQVGIGRGEAGRTKADNLSFCLWMNK